MTLRVLVVGAGYMGRAHARVVRELSRELEVELAGVVDKEPATARRVGEAHGARAFTSLGEALAETRPSVAIVATPTRTHIDVAEQLLEAGVERLLVEKPLDTSLERALEFYQKWRGREGDIMVGYIERFNPAFKLAVTEIRAEVLGEVLTLYARRVGPFTARVMDVGVTLDLATHDLDLLYTMVGEKPRVIDAYARRVRSGTVEDLVVSSLSLGGFRVVLEANRVTAYKERRWIVTGSEAVLQLDFMKQKVSVHRPQWVKESALEWREPLLLEDKAFLESALRGEPVPVPLGEAMVSFRTAHEILARAARID